MAILVQLFVFPFVNTKCRFVQRYSERLPFKSCAIFISCGGLLTFRMNENNYISCAYKRFARSDQQFLRCRFNRETTRMTRLLHDLIRICFVNDRSGY